MRTPTALCFALFLLLPAAANAQARRWVVLSATTSEDNVTSALDVGEHSGAALAASGEVVVPREQAASRIEAQLSQPFRAAPDELVRRIGETTEQALEDVAFGRNQRALDRGQPLLAELDPHIAGLGRNEQAARDIANLCLYMVRAHVQKRDAGAARQQAQLCLRLVPDLEANPEVHPPAVLELLREHHARLDAGEGGILAVHSGPTDPSGCSIRVNGRVLGESPMLRVTIPPGTYLVQMECARGRPGRLHSITVSGASPTRAVLQARLAQALETRPGIALIYADAGALSEHLPADVASLGRVLETNRVLVVVHDGARATLRAFGMTEGEIAELTGSAPVPEPIGDETSRMAVQSVIAGRRIEEPAAAAPIVAAAAVVAPPASDANVAPVAIGATLLTLGAVGLGTSWYFWSELDARGTDLSVAQTPTDVAGTQSEFDEAHYPVVIAFATGAVLATAAIPLLLSEEDGVPWWSWVVGAAGLGVAGVGAYFLATEGDCIANASIARPCLRRYPNQLLGASLLSHAAPLLAVPVTHLVRSALGQSANTSVSLSVEPQAAAVELSGAF